MQDRKEMVVEPHRRRPVYWQGDVAVAGSGISGSFAAIAAAQHGARTILIDRFGSMGGNIGPAMVVAGSILDNPAEKYRVSDSVPGGFAGLNKEYSRRLKALIGPTGDMPIFGQSFASSFVLAEMAREAGVEFLLSSYAADPIVEGKIVKGLFVETCSGRVAISAKVVIDGTGEAAMAARAGAPIIKGFPCDPAWTCKGMEMVHPPQSNPCCTIWNDSHLLVVLAGVDFARYETYRKKKVCLKPADACWVVARPVRWSPDLPRGLVPFARQAFRKRGFSIYADIDEALKHHPQSYISGFADHGGGVVSFRVAARGAIECDNAAQMNRIEQFVRRQAYEYFDLFKQHCPGFEQAFMVGMSNYFGMRGGPCIDGDYLLTVADKWRGRKFEDVIYRDTHHLWCHHAPNDGFDVPYRCLLPKGLEGLLVIGRGAAFQRRGHDPSGMRVRIGMMVMGEAAGTAAALAVKAGLPPRRLKIKQLQRQLLESGINLGPRARLKELGL